VWNFFRREMSGLSCNTKFSYIRNSTHTAYIKKSIDNIHFACPQGTLVRHPIKIWFLYSIWWYTMFVLTTIPQDLHWSNNVHLLPLFTKKKKMMPFVDIHKQYHVGKIGSSLDRKRPFHPFHQHFTMQRTMSIFLTPTHPLNPPS